MKKIIVALTGIMLASSAFNTTHAEEANANHYVLTNKTVASNYQSIVIEGDVDVILVEGTSNQLTMEGYQSQLDNVSMEVSGSTLYINTKSSVSGKRPLVYIPVTNLQSLVVKGKSQVKTLGHLHSDVSVEISGDCKVDLKSTGKITISDASTYEYQIESWKMARN